MYQQQPIIVGGPPISNTVAGTSGIVLRTNLARKKVVFTNSSAGWIFLAPADGAVINAGIGLAPNGGAWVDEPDSLGRIYTGPWYAIGDTGVQNLATLEMM